MDVGVNRFHPVLWMEMTRVCSHLLWLWFSSARFEVYHQLNFCADISTLWKTSILVVMSTTTEPPPPPPPPPPGPDKNPQVAFTALCEAGILLHTCLFSNSSRLSSEPNQTAAVVGPGHIHVKQQGLSYHFSSFHLQQLSVVAFGHAVPAHSLLLQLLCGPDVTLQRCLGE